MRFVIWSWPSDQIHGPLRDVRRKADRADDESNFFGWFLSQLTPTADVSLIGYSYGARIITGGLHLAAGGSLQGMRLPSQPDAGRVRTSVALLAAALDHDWLCPGHLHGAALDHVDQLVVLYNSCDPALRCYDRVDRCTRADALGYVGLCCACGGATLQRVEQLNVAPYIGRTHAEDRYFCSHEIKWQICRALFE
jgi:hypothetical protein